MTLKSAFTEYLDYVKVYNSLGTFDFVRNHATTILSYFGDDYLMQNITAKTIINYMKEQQARGVSNNTINKRVGILKRMAKALKIEAQYKDIKSLSVAFITYGNINKQDMKTIHKSISKLTLRDQLVFYIINDTGLRANELAHILVNKIDLSTQSITVIFTKGKRQRKVPFTNRTGQLIKRYLDTRPLMNNRKDLFLFNDFNTNREAVYRVFKRIKRVSGVKSISAHKLRHTLAGDLYASNQDLLFINRIYGHCNLDTTKRYIPIDDELNLFLYEKYTKGRL